MPCPGTWSKPVFLCSPRVLGTDRQGGEVLTCLDGESGPCGWGRVAGGAGLRTLARLLCGCHDAVAGFGPPGELAWFTGETGVGDDQVICHGDFGPWNIVWRCACPVGILDRGLHPAGASYARHRLRTGVRRAVPR